MDTQNSKANKTIKPQFVGEKQPLENRVDYVRGVTYKAAVDLHEELDDSSYVLLRANNIQDGELRFDDVQYVDRAKVKQKQLLRRGDILFCASSGSKGLVGKAALVRENMPVTFGAFCCVLRPKENEAEYLAHYFQSQQYRRAIEKVCSGSNINNLKAANFFSLVVPHYDDDSTRVICALFDSIDAQIKHAKDQIANLDSLVKSRFIEMFGDPNSKQCEAFIEDAFFIRDDLRKPLSSKERDAMKTGKLYPYYGANGKVDDINQFLTDCDALCFAEDCGSYGPGEPTAYVIRGKAWVNNHAHLLVAKCPHFLEYARTYFTLLDINRFISGTTRAKMTQVQLKKVNIEVPDQAMLREFDGFVSNVDKLRFKTQQQIEKLEMLKASLMQEYFE